MHEDSNELLRVFIDQAPVAIAMFDRDVRYVAASRRWLSDYGLTDRNLRGLCHYDVFPDIPPHWRAIHQRALLGEVIACDEDRFDRADGDVQFVRWEVRPWFSAREPGGFTIFAEDITRRVRDREHVLLLNAELEERVRERTAQLEDNVMKLQGALAEADRLRCELREQAIRDPLTGLFNRRYLEEILLHEVARARRTRSRFGVLMFDMDNFKELNDNFGHAAGDAVLRSVGKVVSARLRAQDVACRFGGDEFTLVLPETSLENAVLKANELLGRLQHMHLEVLELPLPCVEFSMGVASYPTHGESAPEVLRAADAALYRAKELGGARVVHASG